MSEPTVKELFYTPSGDPTDPGGGGGSETDWDNIVDKPSGSSEWQTETGFGTIVTFAGDQNLQTTDDVTFNSATLSNLTSGRVAYAGASGLLQDSANLTFDGTNLALASATFGANNALTGTLGDARYGRLGSANTWTASNAFSNLLTADSDTFADHIAIDRTGNAGISTIFHLTSTFSGDDDILRILGNDGSNNSLLDLAWDTVASEASARFHGDVEKNDFSTGVTDFSGTGWQGTSGGDFNIRNLIVRESARFRELIIDQLSIIAGSDLLSVARGKIESIDNGANTVTIEDPNNRGATRFVANDFFWVKSVDIDNSTIVDLKGQVTAVSGTTLTLDTTVAGGTHAGGTTDISSLSVGDVIAQRGHPSNTDRQALIYRTVSDSDAPVEKFLDGIDSLGAFDTTSNIVVEIGPTSGHFGANNILSYSPDEVGLAGFTADSNSLIRTEGTVEITMGSPNAYATSALGFHVGSDAQNRIYMAELNGDYEILANVGGTVRMRLGSVDNFISDLDIAGTLTMGASGEITNSEGGYVLDNDGITMLGPQGSTSPAGFSLEWIGASDGAAVASIWGQLSTPKTGLNIESQNEIRFRLFDTDSIVWESAAASTTSPNTDTGRIKVSVNGSTRYIKLYA